MSAVLNTCSVQVANRIIQELRNPAVQAAVMEKFKAAAAPNQQDAGAAHISMAAGMPPLSTTMPPSSAMDLDCAHSADEIDIEQPAQFGYYSDHPSATPATITWQKKVNRSDTDAGGASYEMSKRTSDGPLHADTTAVKCASCGRRGSNKACTEKLCKQCCQRHRAQTSGYHCGVHSQQNGTNALPHNYEQRRVVMAQPAAQVRGRS
jgi:hypothetical protein